MRRDEIRPSPFLDDAAKDPDVVGKCCDYQDFLGVYDTAVAALGDNGMRLYWTEKLMEECYQQGDKEESLGLEISPMCDRKNAKPIPAGQIGFYKFVAGPLMGELHSFFPELAENAKQYEDNLERWTKLAENVSE